MNNVLEDTNIKDALNKAQVIAVVGHSDKPHRTSYQIAQYLRNVGYTVIPVNPTVEHINGEKSYPSVKAIPQKVDIVDVFRRSEHLPEIVADAIAAGADMIWTQLGVVHDQALENAAHAGLELVVDRCIKVEHMRLAVPWKKTPGKYDMHANGT
jgi:hypothetical protein